MILRVGTSGYGYKEWKGTFYPDDVPAGEMLRYYAERLPTVEINNTFYRLPRRSVLETWAGQVPEGFRFAIKASRRITHFKRLEGADSEMAYLLRNVQVLGDRLGVLLFQLHPGFSKDLDRLRRFLELLPDGSAAAFEFRHASWNDPAVHDVLRDRNLATCFVDMGQGEKDSPPDTADWGYLRLRRPSYTEAALVSWAKRILDQGWREAYVFVKHEDAGAGPRMAGRLAEIAHDV